jgi:hypothetical protein
MSDNYISANDSIRVVNLTLSELKKLKKENSDKQLAKIASLQDEYNIKDRNLNEAENIILRYKSIQITELKPEVDTIYITVADSSNTDVIQPEKKVIKRNYEFNNGCIYFTASMLFDDKFHLNVINPGFKTNISILDYTRRKPVKLLFGLRIGKKENNMIAKSDCGTVEVVKYKKVK